MLKIYVLVHLQVHILSSPFLLIVNANEKRHDFIYHLHTYD